MQTETVQGGTPSAATADQAAAFGARYAEIQQFYARHMQLLDADRAEEWAATFAEDATFQVPTLPEPVRGRAALISSVRRSAGERASIGERHRHWQSMMAIEELPDGSIRASSYALVFASVIGGESRLHRVCTCEDVLVREDGRLLVKQRTVTRDDLA